MRTVLRIALDIVSALFGGLSLIAALSQLKGKEKPISASVMIAGSLALLVAVIVHIAAQRADWLIALAGCAAICAAAIWNGVKGGQLHIRHHLIRIALSLVLIAGFIRMDGGLSIGKGALWVLGWFGVMLFYTLLDVAVWRKAAPRAARVLDLLTTALCMGGFLILLGTKGGFRLDLTYAVTLQGVILALGCAAALYLLLDRFLDPLFEGMVPRSEERYQETLKTLREAPAIGFIQVCILSPFMEEILMRGLLLGGWSVSCGKAAALALSSAVFALLHFNMVQTLSALIAGTVLGLLYLHTGSVTCCIAAHAGYNMISFFTTISRK